MRDLNVLVPSIGRPTHPSLCKCLRDNGERHIRIVGVDIDADGLGPHLADRFYKVPPRKDPGYIDVILDICAREKTDVYYALGEEEAIASAGRRPAFEAIGTRVITPGTPEMLAIATNKCLWHEYFEQQGIPHADFRKVGSVDAVAAAARELGYPGCDVVFKPAVAKGGRGARIITARDLTEEYYSTNSGEPRMSLETFVDMLSPLRDGKFAPLLAMEYLPGTYYSVDVLSRDGRVIYAIPKLRLSGSASNTTVGQVDLNPATIELAGTACRSFQFSYLQNYEMKLDRRGRPQIYDINPRGGASLTLCAAAGVNIAYYAVKMAVGEEVPRKEIRDKVKMIRFYDEHFTSPPSSL